MTCPGCGRTLARHEIAQTVPVATGFFRPASFCDACCRGGAWQAGSAASLERLARGEVDPAERDRLAGETPSPLEPVAETVRRAAAAGGFEIPAAVRAEGA